MSTWRKQAFRLKPWLICAYAKPGAELQTSLLRMVAFLESALSARL
jgi:hypothetical protein